MEKPSKNIDDFTRKLVKEAGVSKPSLDFTNRVLEAIEAKTVVSKGFSPLISKKGWLFIAITTIGCFAILFVMPNSDGSLIESLGLKNPVSFEYTLPKIEFSKTMIYAVGFMSLFLIQIPFLKNYIQKNYD